jgi:hypothetical protein
MQGKKFRQLSVASILMVVATSTGVRSQNVRPWVDPPADLEVRTPSVPPGPAAPAEAMLQDDSAREHRTPAKAAATPPATTEVDQVKASSASLNPPSTARERATMQARTVKIRHRTVRPSSGRHKILARNLTPLAKLFGPPRRNANIITTDGAVR